MLFSTYAAVLAAERSLMMSKKLRYTANMLPCLYEKIDTVVSHRAYTYNLSKMVSHIQEFPNQYIKQKINLSAYYDPAGYPNPNLLKYDYSCIPIVLVEMEPDQYEIVSGYNKIEQALQNGIKELDAFFVIASQHIRFMATDKSCMDFIGSWNAAVDSSNH